ncbi:hypothetical protein MNBD_GAMMA10-665 [hydrothermal vent metagenome]|uniref:Uncharacterized protein n=1 Tax=hydrothermal vent metagenome TaxID=652676 RepID=A0A3B0Y5M7_9ZZZZ
MRSVNRRDADAEPTGMYLRRLLNSGHSFLSIYFNLEKSVESRNSAQALDLYSYMKKVFITNEVVENCSCIFYSPTFHGPL